MPSWSPSRFLTCAIAAMAAGAVSCSDAGGTVFGGEPEFDAGAAAATPDADVGAVTWTELYATYFGPTAKATCTAAGSQYSCHSSASDQGTMSSGFVCGATKDSCWSGLVQPPPALAASGSLVPPGGSTSPATTSFYENLRGTANGTMPLQGPNNAPGYVFTPTDLARIAAWIDQGAQND